MCLDHTGYPTLILYTSLTFKQDDVFEYEDDDLSASGSDFLSLYTKFSLLDACCTGTVHMLVQTKRIQAWKKLSCSGDILQEQCT